MFAAPERPVCRICQLQEEFVEMLTDAKNKISALTRKQEDANIKIEALTIKNQEDANKIDVLTKKLETLQEFVALNVGVPPIPAAAPSSNQSAPTVTSATTNEPTPISADQTTTSENNDAATTQDEIQNDGPTQEIQRSTTPAGDEASIQPPARNDGYQVVRSNKQVRPRKIIPIIACQNKYQILSDLEEQDHSEEVRLVGDSMIRGQLAEFCARAPKARKRFCIPGGGLHDITEAAEEVTRQVVHEPGGLVGTILGQEIS